MSVKSFDTTEETNVSNSIELEEEGESQSNEVDVIGKYIGERDDNGYRHGNGWDILPNGDQYDGKHRHGKRHGTGLYVFKNGARYFGTYKCGLKSGYGTFFYPDGSIYSGLWKRDLKHGEGVYIYRNGDRYQGRYHQGKRHGLGSYFYKGTNSKFTGTWIEGTRIGPAEVFSSGYRFHGNWHKRYPLGRGIFTFNCCKKYMLSGFYKSGENDLSKESQDSNEQQTKKLLEKDFVETETVTFEANNPPIWISDEILPYDFTKLPQQPVPLAISDSEQSISCGVSTLCIGSEHSNLESDEGEKTSNSGTATEIFSLSTETSLDKNCILSHV